MCNPDQTYAERHTYIVFLFDTLRHRSPQVRLCLPRNVFVSGSRIKFLMHSPYFIPFVSKFVSHLKYSLPHIPNFYLSCSDCLRFCNQYNHDTLSLTNGLLFVVTRHCSRPVCPRFGDYCTDFNVQLKITVYTKVTDIS